jgi:hypothetical protein
VFSIMSSIEVIPTGSHVFFQLGFVPPYPYLCRENVTMQQC